MKTMKLSLLMDLKIEKELMLHVTPVQKPTLANFEMGQLCLPTELKALLLALDKFINFSDSLSTLQFLQGCFF